MQTRYLSLLLSALLFSCLPLAAQDFSEVDARARKTPFPKKQNIDQLAASLTEGLRTEKEKVRAFYVWITANIRYDVKTFENKREIDPTEKDALQAPEQVLRRKMGVCAGYANLFQALCDASDIEAIRVTGIVKNHRGRIPRIGHAWNLVRADSQWGLIDATWGAGDVDTDAGKYTPRFKEDYFFAAPETLILNHYPNDPLFQLLPAPLTPEEFRQGQAAVQQTVSDNDADETRAVYAPKDSLDAFVRLDSAAQLLHSSLRIVRFDPGNNMGLWGLAWSQYSAAIDNLQRVQQEMNGLALDPRNPELAAVLDRNIDRFSAAETHLNACLATADKITTAGGYHKAARQLQATARKNLLECAKSKEVLEKTRERMRK
ncbi:MAG: transglutaminase domain-containing protein [Saprospiraceae bacterium]